MLPDPRRLLEIAGISGPLVGFYDTPDIGPFAPYATADRCIFSCYADWMRGKSTCLADDSADAVGCPGAGYWLCNVASMPPTAMAEYLAGAEGLKASPELMCQWLANHPPYRKRYRYAVIGPLRMDQYAYVQTITFYVDPDQLSLLITGAEYHNASAARRPVSTAFGVGCGQLAAVFPDFEAPAATIGAMDIAMRPYLPANTLAFTVTRPMFEQLCSLDENSFLHKTFWGKVVAVNNNCAAISNHLLSVA